MKFQLLLLSFLLSIQIVVAQNITGSWKGELKTQTITLPLIFHISKNGDDYRATLDSPTQHATGIKASSVVYRENELLIEVASINLKFAGTISEDEKLVGKLTQNGMTFPMSLERLLSGAASDLSHTVPTTMEERLRQTDRYIDFLEEHNLEAGKVSLFKDGKEIYKRTFGQNNLPQYSPDHELFRVGSITKTFTAVMVHELIREKKLKLHDLLSKYFPEAPNAKQITIAQLVNHSSGLGDYVQHQQKERWLTERATDDQILRHISSQNPLFAPGSSESYSNSGYYLLANIIEKVTGKTFAQNLQERILKPLALSDTFSELQNPRKVFPSYSYAGSWKHVQDFDFTNIVGVGDIASTPTDLNKFITALFTGKLLSLENVRQILPEKNKRFGMGILKVPFYQNIFYGHSGGTYGTNSLMSYNPDDNTAFSYTINADRIGTNNFAIAVLSTLYGIDFSYPTVTSERTTVEQLQQYVGNYTSKDHPLGILVFVKDDNLFAQGTGQPSFPLEYQGGDSFKFDQADVKLTFQPQKDTMSLTQAGETVEFKKTTSP